MRIITMIFVGDDEGKIFEGERGEGVMRPVMNFLRR